MEAFWIFSDVVAGPFEVLLRADEAIPIFGLPEFAGSLEMVVDLVAGEALDGMNDVFERVAFDEFQDDVDVVGHDDVAVEMVAGLIEVVEGVGNDGGTGGIFEEALAVGLVEEIFEWEGEAAIVFSGGFVVPRFWMEFEPGFSRLVYVFDDRFGERVGKTPSDEDEGVVLVPVGEAKAMFLDRFVGMEEHIRSSAVSA